MGCNQGKVKAKAARKGQGPEGTGGCQDGQGHKDRTSVVASSGIMTAKEVQIQCSAMSTFEASEFIASAEGTKGSATGAPATSGPDKIGSIRFLTEGRLLEDWVATATVGQGSSDAGSQPLSSCIVKHRGGVAIGVMAQSIKTEKLHSSVTQNVFRLNEKEKPVDHFWTAEAPTQTLADRKELMETIHEKLKTCVNHLALIKRTVALVAMGGMGKTETARLFVQQNRNQFENVAWIDAETESSTRDSFQTVAKILKIPHSHDVEGKTLARQVYRHVSEHVKKPSLFVFDNTNQLKTEGNTFGILEYITTEVVNNLPLILLTSQSAEWSLYQCQVIEVTHISYEDSFRFFLSWFKLSTEEVQADADLQALLSSLLGKLNGYPMALGLAAASIRYTPGLSCLSLLKHSLWRYIQRVDDQSFLQQAINTSLATKYPHTLLNLWQITMSNLDRREHRLEARCLLAILAHLPQESLDEEIAEAVYQATNKRYELTFPGESDASYEEAVHELQMVGLVRVKEDGPKSQIRMHRLVQTLGRLEKEAGLGMQKIIAYNLQHECVLNIRDEYLCSKHGVAEWVLVDELKALAWLDGIRLRTQENGTIYCSKWKEQLEVFPNGKDIAIVADFIIKNDRPLAKPGENVPCTSWAFIDNALKARSALAGHNPGIRAYLELAITSVVYAMITVNISLSLWDSGSWTELQKLKDSFKSLNDWYSEIDYGAILSTCDKLPGLIHPADALVWLTRVSNYAPCGRINFVSLDALYMPSAFMITIGYNGIMAHTLQFFLLRLFTIWDPEWVADLMEEYNLLQMLAIALSHSECLCQADWPEGQLANLGIIRQLALRSDYAQRVFQHPSLLERLKKSYTPECNSPTFAVPMSVTRMRRAMNIGGSTFSNEHDTIFASDSTCNTNIFLPYCYLQLAFALYTALPSPEDLTSCILADLLPSEKCKQAISSLAALEFCAGLKATDIENPWDYMATEERYFTAEEFQENKTILNQALEKLQNTAKSTDDSCWNALLIQLAQHLLQISDNVLSVCKSHD